MKSSKIDRRAFLSNSARAGFTACGACVVSQFPALAWARGAPESGEKLDPKELNYCGYTCPTDCKFLTATLENDVELKREAYEIWKIEERFGIEFDPEHAFCYGCKTLDKPEGIVLQRCDVRACVRDKKLECCIECDELEACDKDLWRRFPKFKEQVVEMRVRYLQQT